VISEQHSRVSAHNAQHLTEEQDEMEWPDGGSMNSDAGVPI
jgi:hypothetical protein